MGTRRYRYNSTDSWHFDTFKPWSCFERKKNHFQWICTFLWNSLSVDNPMFQKGLLFIFTPFEVPKVHFYLFSSTDFILFFHAKVESIFFLAPGTRSNESSHQVAGTMIWLYQTFKEKMVYKHTTWRIFIAIYKKWWRSVWSAN